jgi:ATP-dependent RNA helicase DHX57
MKMVTEGQPQSNIRRFCEEVRPYILMFDIQLTSGKNFISTSICREVMILRQDFVSALSEIGFIPNDSTPSTPLLNTSSGNLNLVKAITLGGLWPRVARVHLPKEKIKFDKVSAGAVQRENTAKDFKIYDLQEGRVFLHPGSVLFGMADWKPPFLVYFHKYMTNKIFLRDATKVR